MKLLQTVLIGSTLALSAVPAFAQQRSGTGSHHAMGANADSWGTYGGVSVGDASDFDTSFKLFLGQQFHPNLAWEAQVVNFGERDNRPYFGSKTSAWSAGGSLVGLLPLSTDFSLFGKVGLHYVKTRTTFPTYSSSNSDVSLGVGIGGRYRLTQQLSLRMEFEDIGDGGDLFSVGLQLRF